MPSFFNVSVIPEINDVVYIKDMVRISMKRDKILSGHTTPACILVFNTSPGTITTEHANIAIAAQANCVK